MPLVVDTNVILDLWMNDPAFATSSASCLTKHFQNGLVISPISYVELAPAFRGDWTVLEAYLRQLGISYAEPWTSQDSRKGHELWDLFISLKRQNLVPKRPVADVLIAAFAIRHDGLITRNAADFKWAPPQLKIVVP
jgi:predicted nucleic acid-binding protein